MQIVSFTARGVLVPHTLADIQSALRGQGHTVLVQDIAALPSHRDQTIAIIDALVHYAPDLVFTVDQIGLLPTALALLRKPEHIISWIFDDPRRWLRDDLLCINSRLHCALWDRAYLPFLNSQGFARLSHHPFASNPAVYRPLAASGAYAVSFVGRASRRRLDLLGALGAAGIKTDVFGDAGWSQLRQANVRWHGPAGNRTDCPGIFSGSRINLNITSDQLLTAAPLRVFDVLACGGFLLTDRREDIERLFRDGEDLVIYDDHEDLIRKIRYYLERPDLCARIGAAGRRRVLAEHTFDHKVARLMQHALVAPPGIVNAVLPAARLRQTRLLLALAFLKFENYNDACALLMETLRELPGDGMALLLMALLAGRLGRTETVGSCLELLQTIDASLAALGAELTAGRAPGSSIACWDRLYALLYPEATINLAPDGTVPGWRPSAG